MTADRADPGRARRGIAFALAAAGISGVAVFLNADAVKAFPSGTVATTYKNLVAAVLLAGLAALAAARQPGSALVRPRRAAQWWGLAVVAVVGGSIPFVLFFEGLSRRPRCGPRSCRRPSWSGSPSWPWWCCASGCGPSTWRRSPCSSGARPPSAGG